MTIHKSLKTSDVLKRQRNVLTRWERIEALREQEAWHEGGSVFGLPKVRVYHHRKRVRTKKEAAEETPVGEGTETAEGTETSASKDESTPQRKS